MEEKDLKRQIQSEGTHSNIIFGTSSDDIEQGLHNNQFIDDTYVNNPDKDQVVNEEQQKEIVNPSVETFNEELSPQTLTTDKTSASEQANPPNQLEENVMELDPDNKDVDKTRKISESAD